LRSWLFFRLSPTANGFAVGKQNIIGFQRIVMADRNRVPISIELAVICHYTPAPS
jgi:hypothetical protein